MQTRTRLILQSHVGWIYDDAKLQYAHWQDDAKRADLFFHLNVDQLDPKKMLLLWTHTHQTSPTLIELADVNNVPIDSIDDFFLLMTGRPKRHLSLKTEGNADADR